MKKIHTRLKRKFGLSTGLSHYHFFHPCTNKKNRPKTFKTEESANAWVRKYGLKKEQYYLKKVKRNKKFQVVRYNGKNKDITNKEGNS